MVFEEWRAPGGRQPAHIDDVLDANRDTCERTDWFARRDLRINPPGGSHGAFRVDSHPGV
jgi:hypothetical protein